MQLWAVLFINNQWHTEGGGLGGSNPPSPRNSEDIGGVPKSHEQEELAPRFPFVVHCVLIRFNLLNKGFF